MHQWGKSNGPRRHSRGFDFGDFGLQILRGSDGSAEKVRANITAIFDGPFRVDVKTLELHPEDHACVTSALENLGYSARASKNHIFINERYRATFAVDAVHLTDLRSYD